MYTICIVFLMLNCERMYHYIQKTLYLANIKVYFSLSLIVLVCLCIVFLFSQKCLVILG